MKLVVRTSSLFLGGVAKVAAIFLLSLAPLAAGAAICTTQSTGNWSNRNIWNCGHVPNNADTVVIAHNITLDRDDTVAGLTINTGITLTASNNRDLTVTGNIVNNGTYTSNGDRIYMTGAGATISGSGSFSDTRLYVDANNITLTASSTMNFSGGASIRVGRNSSASLTIAGTITDIGQPVGDRILRLENNNPSSVIITGTLNTPNSFVEIQNGGILTNNGTANIRYLDGDNANGATWNQGANSNLTMTQPAQGWRGTFNASAAGNTVTYNGTSTPLTPSGNTYFNLAGAYFNAPGSCPHSFTVLGTDPCATTPGSGSTTGSPTLCVNDTSVGTYAWNGLNNVGSSDNQYATADGRNSSITNYLKCTGYNFNIPADAIIDGIELNIEGRSLRTFTDYAVNLVKADTIQTATNYANGNAFRSNNDLTFTYGTPTDLWGTTWLPSEINSTTFGIAFAAQRGPYTRTDTIRVDHMPITIHYHTPSTPIAYYAMDEMTWNGTAGEVADGSGTGNNGVAVNAATTSLTNPVNANNPGTCRYGAFDGTDDYVQLPSSFPNLQGSFTISAWIRPEILTGDQRIFADDRNNSGGFAFSLGDGGAGRLRLFSRNVSPIWLDTGAIIQQNQWQYVTAVHDANTKTRRIYVNGSLVSFDTYTGTWGSDSGPATIGGEADGSSEATARWRFQGGIDEVRVYDFAQTAAAIVADMNSTHPCTAQVDHYRVLHDGSALSCSPEQITVQACADATCTSLYTGGASGTVSPTSTNFNIPTGAGQVTFSIRNNAGGAINLSDLVNLNPAPATTPATCQDTTANTTSCTLMFHDSGFLLGVPTLTSCATSNATIRAVRKDPTTENCVSVFDVAGDKTVKFRATYSSPTTNPASTQVAINGNNVVTVPSGSINTSTTDVSVTFDINGSGEFNIAYPDAGMIQLDAAFTGATGTVEEGLSLSGNSSFVSVPAKFIVSDGTTANCATGFADASCAVFKKAGEAFSLTVDAACDNGTVTPNFDTTDTNTSNIALTHTLIAPTGGNNGNLGQANIDIAEGNSGSVTITNQTISEVGVFTITAALDSYLGVNAATPPLIQGTSSNIGRFIPARLVVTPNTPILANACTTGANPFTYLDLDFGFSTNPILTVTAQNTSGTFTQNYGGNFWKLSGTLANRSYADTVGATAFTPTYSAAAPTLAEANNFDAIPPTLTITGDILNYGRPVAPVNAFASNVDLTIPAADLTDSDGVCYDAAASVVCNTNGGLGNPVDLTIAGITGANLRYGIGISSNVMNPDTAIGTIIVLPITAQYYDAAGAPANNVDDMCSPVVYAKVDNGIATNVVPGSPVTLAAGSGNLTVTLTADIGGDIGGFSDFALAWPVWIPGPANATAIFGAIPSDNNYLYWNESR